MKKIFSLMIIAAVLAACNSEEKKAETAATDTAPAAGKAPVELLNDSSFVASNRAAMTAFQNKDINGYTANMADNIKFRWSNGDSLTGIQAVKDYWSARLNNIIDTIKFSDHIDLPLMANASPNGVTATGKWMLTWHRVNVTYKNGKSLQFWVHNAQHFNDAGKMDEYIQYMDRHPVIEATKDMVK